MEKERVLQGYVVSLEQTIRNTHLDLKEMITEFEELCRRVTPDRTVPMQIIARVRKTYKEIQDQLRKISGVDQLLRSKYRRYYHRDCLRDREVTESVFMAKNLYLKFESTFQEIEAKRKLRDGGEGFEMCAQRIPFPWFYTRENRAMLLRNLQSLYELRYRTQPDSEVGERRRVIQKSRRSLSLFVLSGEIGLIDLLQSRMQMREYDIKERYAKNELRGALTHLREISPSQVEKVIRRFMGCSESSKLKGLLIPIQFQKDLEKEILGSADEILRATTEGEVKILSI